MKAEQEISREQFLNKPLPSNAEGERVILGAILLDNSLITQAIETLTANDFYSPFHRQVFAAMLKLFEKSANINPVLIGEELKKDGSLDSIGGVAAITNLSYGLPHFSDIEDYVKVVKDKSVVRNVVKVCNIITSDALAEEFDDTGEFLNAAEKLIADCRPDQHVDDEISLKETLKQVVADIQQRAKNPNRKLVGVPTGFTDIDYVTSGLEPSDLIIISARPSMGKTSLALDIVQNAVAINPELVVGVFSLETSRKGIASRLLSSVARVSSTRLKNAHLTRDDYGRIAQGLESLVDTGIELRTKPRTVIEIKAACRKILRQRKRLDLIVIDQLNLMIGDKSEGRTAEMSEMVRQLKNMATEFDVPIILLCQLNRDCEKRNPPIPVMSDHKDAGTIEEVADKVFMIYRAEYYLKDRTPDEQLGVAEIHVVKNRDGETGVIKLAFLSEFTRFENYFGD